MAWCSKLCFIFIYISVMYAPGSSSQTFKYYHIWNTYSIASSLSIGGTCVSCICISCCAFCKCVSQKWGRNRRRRGHPRVDLLITYSARQLAPTVSQSTISRQAPNSSQVNTSGGQQALAPRKTVPVLQETRYTSVYPWSELQAS